MRFARVFDLTKGLYSSDADNFACSIWKTFSVMSRNLEKRGFLFPCVCVLNAGKCEKGNSENS